MRLKLISVTAVLALAGCATANWQHPKIADKSTMARQLVIDDGYCTQVANGSAPMPQIVAPETPTTTTFNARGTTYNSSTGTTTYGNYTGQATTMPSGGFAGGFSSGMASGASIGAAFNARRAQDSIHKSCMYAKGWFDMPAGTAIPDAAPAPAPAVAAQKVSKPALSFDDPALVYTNGTEEWHAQAGEFLKFYPDYSSGKLHQNFDSKVRAIAKERRELTGPQVLFAAHAALTAAGQPAPEPKSEGLSIPLSFYKGAAAGKVLDQTAFGIMNMNGSEEFPIDYKRAAAWFQAPAVAGNSLAQQCLALLLFEGLGVAKNRAEGYRLMQKAAVNDPDARELLTKLSQQMTPAELQQVRQ